VPSSPAPDTTGTLDVGDGQSLAWECCGNPQGRPALYLHGGPGSGVAPWARRFFDLTRLRVVLFDQRGCGRYLFARLVTHYWRHAAFLGHDQLIQNAGILYGIPGVLVHGRYDVSGPLETAWRLHQGWPTSALRILDDAGHGGGSMSRAVFEAVGAVTAMASVSRPTRVAPPP
jgi:pimeloyl-ACP methyl ester carboxylesterase